MWLVTLTPSLQAGEQHKELSSSVQLSWGQGAAGGAVGWGSLSSCCVSFSLYQFFLSFSCTVAIEKIAHKLFDQFIEQMLAKVCAHSHSAIPSFSHTSIPPFPQTATEECASELESLTQLLLFKFNHIRGRIKQLADKFISKIVDKWDIFITGFNLFFIPTVSVLACACDKMWTYNVDFFHAPLNLSILATIVHSPIPPCQVLPSPVEQESSVHNVGPPPPALPLPPHHGNNPLSCDCHVTSHVTTPGVRETSQWGGDSPLSPSLHHHPWECHQERGMYLVRINFWEQYIFNERNL